MPFINARRAPYKYCFVPNCPSTTCKTPNKLFISVPMGHARKRWLKAVRRGDKLSLKSTHYCCEDHFNVDQDFENWREYKWHFTTQLRLKPGVLPHRFDCHPGRKECHTPNTARSRRAARKQAHTLVQDLLSSPPTPSTVTLNIAGSTTPATTKYNLARVTPGCDRPQHEPADPETDQFCNTSSVTQDISESRALRVDPFFVKQEKPNTFEFRDPDSEPLSTKLDILFVKQEIPDTFPTQLESDLLGTNSFSLDRIENEPLDIKYELFLYDSTSSNLFLQL